MMLFNAQQPPPPPIPTQYVQRSRELQITPWEAWVIQSAAKSIAIQIALELNPNGYQVAPGEALRDVLRTYPQIDEQTPLDIDIVFSTPKENRPGTVPGGTVGTWFFRDGTFSLTAGLVQLNEYAGTRTDLLDLAVPGSDVWRAVEDALRRHVNAQLQRDAVPSPWGGYGVAIHESSAPALR